MRSGSDHTLQPHEVSALHRSLAIVLILVFAFAAMAPVPARASDPSADPSASAEPTPEPTTLAEPTPEPTTSAEPSTMPEPSEPATPEPDADEPDGEADLLEPGSITLADGTVLPPMPDGLRPSIHAEMLAAHAEDPNEFEPGGPPTILRAVDGTVTSAAEAPGPSVMSAGLDGATAGLPSGMQREVIGFLPYWELKSSSLQYMNYQLVSTVAYFGVDALPDGNLDKGTSANPSVGWAGWNSSHMTTVIDRAHAAGAKVVLTVTMMAWNTTSWERMRTLLNSSQNRSRLVSQIVDAVRTRGADGVNLDFELVPTDLRDQYTSFVRQVKSALTTAGVGSHVSVCTTGGAASWATGYDVSALVATGAADVLFVMGYDFNWTGSTRAGGVAPIDSPYTLDVSTALADFLRQVPASKLVWGVPYYGRGWNTTSSQLNGVTTGGSFSYYYTGHLGGAGSHGRLWDAVGKVPWYRYWDASKSTWVQVYYDDAQSLGVKYDLVNRYNLAGTGVWHLLMDAGRDELWRLIADRFVNDTTPPSGGIRILPPRTTSMGIEVAWHALDYQSGLDRYNVQVRDRNTTTWATLLSGTRATSTIYIGEPGKTYEFRVQAIDYKGNAQPWLTAPGMASTVRPGTFSVVTTSSLNVRSGAGTSFASVGTLVNGDRVYVMSGPVSADGLSWFQVQHGFTEWPSAEYPNIGWVAAGSGSTPYLAPSYAPSVTRLQPFMEDYTRSRTAFSSVVSIRYRLPQSVASMRVDVVDAADQLVRRLALAAQPAGSNQVSWDGRRSDGSLAPEGRYLVKIFVTDGSGVTHAAPVAGNAANVMARWGVTLDRTPPRVVSATPADGSDMVPASVAPSVTFSEPMAGLTPASVRLERIGSSSVAVGLSWNAATRTLQVTPAQPLLPGVTYRLLLAEGPADAAGNPLGTWETTFTVAPGAVYDPWERLTVRPGTHTGYRIGTGGAVVATKSATFNVASGASVSQRATIPNLPGRWLYVENGLWSGHWLPESAGTHLGGTTELAGVPSTTRLVFAAGTHTGYTFTSSGAIAGTRTATLARASGANTSARAIINGRPHWHVLNGMWAGYWVPESTRAYRAGFVDPQVMGVHPRIALQAGTYTGYAYDASGNRTGSKTATLARASGTWISDAAVINGRLHYRITAGIWAGLWMPVDERVTFAP